MCFELCITETCLFKYIENFTSKTDFFSNKNSDSFHIFAQNIDCGYLLEPAQRGGSNEYPQSMFLSKNMKNKVNLFKSQFYYIKMGFKGSILYWHVFVMVWLFAVGLFTCFVLSLPYCCVK